MKKVIEAVKSVGTKFSLLALSVGSMAGVARAQSEMFGENRIKAIPLLGSGTLNDLIGKIITAVLIIAGVLAVFYLIWGGISYVTAGGDAEKASKGRVAITNAIIGIIIILAALLIYNYVIDTIAT